MTRRYSLSKQEREEIITTYGGSFPRDYLLSSGQKGRGKTSITESCWTTRMRMHMGNFYLFAVHLPRTARERVYRVPANLAWEYIQQAEWNYDEQRIYLDISSDHKLAFQGKQRVLMNVKKYQVSAPYSTRTAPHERRQERAHSAPSSRILPESTSKSAIALALLLELTTQLVNEVRRLTARVEILDNQANYTSRPSTVTRVVARVGTFMRHAATFVCKVLSNIGATFKAYSREQTGRSVKG